MTNRARRRFALGSLVVTAALISCRAKEQPAPARPQESPASAAPTTTVPPTTTTVPPPPPVWRGARWGMTKDEVLAAFPGEAQRLAAPVEFGPQTAGSSDVAIPVYEVDGVKFRVVFGFDAEALNRVYLSAAKAEHATCGDLEKVLTEKHAAPAQRDNTGTSLRGEQVTWKLPDQTIVLSCAGLPSLGYRSVTLDHRAPSLEAAKGTSQ